MSETELRRVCATPPPAVSLRSPYLGSRGGLWRLRCAAVRNVTHSLAILCPLCRSVSQRDRPALTVRNSSTHGLFIRRTSHRAVAYDDCTAPSVRNTFTHSLSLFSMFSVCANRSPRLICFYWSYQSDSILTALILARNTVH